MNSIIQKTGRANQTWIKLPANVSSIGKNNPDFFQNFTMVSLAKKSKKRKWRIMIWKFGKIFIYRVRHIKCYRTITLKLLIISKNVSDKSFSVREGCHTGPPYFFIGGGAEATSRSTPLFKMEPCIFFSMTLLPILIRIQRPTTQGHSSYAKYENRRKIIFISFLRYPW